MHYMRSGRRLSTRRRHSLSLMITRVVVPCVRKLGDRCNGGGGGAGDDDVAAGVAAVSSVGVSVAIDFTDDDGCRIAERNERPPPLAGDNNSDGARTCGGRIDNHISVINNMMDNADIIMTSITIVP